VRKNSRVSDGTEKSTITTIKPRNGPAFAMTFLAVSFIAESELAAKPRGRDNTTFL
jgi:hypothetical protein